jgi:MFS family permease
MKLNPTVKKLGLVSLFADISSEMLYPITPIFLTTVLGTSMSAVGLIEGVAEAIASLMKTYSGLWSDRLKKRKIFVSLGYFLSAIAKPLTGLASSWGFVLMARGLDRSGKGLRSAPRDALIAESVSADVLGAAFGWHRSMDSMGAVIGPLLALLYLSYFADHLRPIYYWAIIPGFISVLISLSVKESNSTAKKPQKKFPSLTLKKMSPEFKRYLIAWGVFSLCNSSDVFLLMKAKAAGLSLATVVLLYCFYNLIYSFSSPYLGHLSDRMGRRHLLIFGLFIFSCVYYLFTLANLSWHFFVLFGVYGIYMGATDGIGKAGAIDLVDPELKATGIGILGTVSGLATLIASSAAGFLWDHAGSNWPFYIGALGSLLAIFVFLSVPSTQTQPSLDQQ